MTSYPVHGPRRSTDSLSGAFWMFAAIALGLLVSVVGFFTVMMWASARDGDGSSPAPPAQTSASAMPGMDMTGAAASTGSLTSYAGAAPADADELAAAHAPFPAALPAAPAGPVAHVSLVLKDVTIQVAPGVRYAA